MSFDAVLHDWVTRRCPMSELYLRSARGRCLTVEICRDGRRRQTAGERVVNGAQRYRLEHELTPSVSAWRHAVRRAAADE